MLNSQEITEAKFVKRTERAERDMGLGGTDAGLAISAKYIAETSEIVKAKLAGGIGRTPKEVHDLDDPALIALVAIHTGLSCVAEDMSLSKTLFQLGSALEIECEAWAMKNWNGLLFERFVEYV